MPGDPLEITAPLFRQAVERWQRRAGERARSASDAAAPRDVRDTPERGALYRARVRQRSSRGALPSERGLERHIGRTSELHSIEFLEQGMQAARAVVRVSVYGGARNGTAVLVAPGVALTNHHVVPDRRTALRTTLVTFDEERRIRPHRERHDLELDPAHFLLTDPALDITFVGVRDPEAPVDNSPALAECGWLPLFGELGKILVGHPVNLIQHPGGRQKHVVTQNSILVDLADGPDATDYCWYTGDTEPGSSGAPVFNNDWEIVALHHRAIPRTNARGEWLDASGRALTPNEIAGGSSRVDWVANEGARCSRIVRALGSAELRDPAMARMRDRMLALWRSPAARRIGFRSGW